LIDVPGSYADSPLFSPDGQHLLFLLDNRQAWKWVVSAPDGSNQRVINTGTSYVRWFPDSKSLLIGNAKTGQISIVDASNGSQLLSISTPSDSFAIDWSPDGESILFEATPLDTLNTKFYVLDVQSKAIREITGQPAEYRNASWSPNSKYVIVEADSLGVGALNGLYIINVEDNSIQKFLGGGNFEPTWSANANLANEVLPTPDVNATATSTPENENSGQSAQLQRS
jgi:Tol biopolymer transport system component